MKTTIQLIATILLLTTCIGAFANYNFIPEPAPVPTIHEVSTRPAITITRHNSFSNHQATTNINCLNLHTNPNGTSFLDKLSIRAGKFNTRHSFMGCPNTKGAVASVHVKYSAISSVALVWDIAWGANNTLSTNKTGGLANNINIVLIMSNPVSTGKSASPLMNKLESNVPLSMLSIAELVVTFG